MTEREEEGRVTMEPGYKDERLELWHGDCLDVMPMLAAGSVDAVICDLR